LKTIIVVFIKGTIGTMIIILYFANRQLKMSALELESQNLNDLFGKIHSAWKVVMERTEITKVIGKSLSNEVIFSCYLLYVMVNGIICVKEIYQVTMSGLVGVHG
jgi:hypothetical protein